MRDHPKRYFGLHMVPGVAEYRPDANTVHRKFISEKVIKEMDATYEGVPLFVGHKPDVPLNEMKDQMDGVVVRSFFNKQDGKTWCEFLAFSDLANDRIKQGWTLSNCYNVDEFAGPGIHVGVEYDQQVMKGSADHIALVPDPRYSESVVLTPEEFKAYNLKKDQELEVQKISNSLEVEKVKQTKKENVSMLKIFKREKVENELDLEQVMVELPKSKKEMSLAQVVNEYDKVMNLAGYADPQHMVKIGNDDMSVGDLAEAYNAMKAKNEEDEKKKAEKPENEEDEEEKPENAEGHDLLVKEDKKATNAKGENFKKLKDAEMIQNSMLGTNLEVSIDKVARGKARYGSNK